jgi:hypothetical protein
MELIVCPRSLLGAILHYVLRLPEQLQTFTPQLRDILKRGFIHSLVINRSIVMGQYVAKPNCFPTIR